MFNIFNLVGFIDCNEFQYAITHPVDSDEILVGEDLRHIRLLAISFKVDREYFEVWVDILHVVLQIIDRGSIIVTVILKAIGYHKIAHQYDIIHHVF